MISHIHSTTIIVSDQDAALDFYVNTLGWEKRMDSPMGDLRWLTVAPAGEKTELALASTEMFGGAAGAPSNPAINLIAADLDATYAEMTAKGVKFAGPVETMPWGAKGATLLDPDGNAFFIAEE